MVSTLLRWRHVGVCPFQLSVNIRLGVFVYSGFLRPSVCTQYVYQSACANIVPHVERAVATSAVPLKKKTVFRSRFFLAHILNNGKKGAINCVFLNARNVFHVKIWPQNQRTDETAAKWARLAYRVLCLTRKRKKKPSNVLRIHSLTLTLGMLS